MNRYLTALPGLIAVLALAGFAALAIDGDSGARADTSGPNASGYEWIDSNAPDPTVPFEWIDATDGTALSLITDEDDDYETVTLPFTFNFFGVDYTQADVSSNGFLSFTVGNDCNDNYNWDDILTPGVDTGHPIPYTDVDCDGDSGWGANPLIAGWFDDLDPGECGDVYYKTVGTTPNQQFVVEYSDVCHNDCDLCVAGEGVTFEIILFEGTNDIKIQYQDTLFSDVSTYEDLLEENNGATATSGIDKDDTVGLGYHWGGDGDTLSDNLAVLYTTGVADLEVTKTTTATSAQVGDQLTYTITVTNHGPADASGVTVTDDLPDAMTYVSATPSQGSCIEASSVVTCDIGDLALDATATIDLVVTVSAEGSLENSASVDADQADTSPSNNTAVADVSAAPAATASPSPSATPAALPDTGGQPESASGSTWLVLMIGSLAGLASGVFAVRMAKRTI